MNLDQIVALGAEVFQKSDLSGDAGSNLDVGAIVSALSGLTGGSGFDIGAILENLNGSGLADLATSWLGDGANQAISPEQIGALFGPDKLNEFASQLGLSESEAAGGLSDALPQMIDSGSTGGNLLDSLGGIEGVLGLAGKLFGK